MSKEAMKLALEALHKGKVACEWGQAHDHVHQIVQAMDSIREALAEQPAQQQELCPSCRNGSIYACTCTFKPAQQKAYEQANPLGGPAKVFDAMADAIRAGDDYHAVLRQYGYAEAQQQEPVGKIGKIVMFGGDLKEVSWKNGKMPPVGSVLYTSPPAQRTWVGLTDDEILYCVELENPKAIAEEVEAKLKEKNT